MDGDEAAVSLWSKPKHLASVGVLLLINLLNYMDRYTVAGVLTEIQSYFGIDDASAGLLQTVFIIFYMVFAPVCGYLGDRYNRKLMIQSGLFIWMCAVLLSTLTGPAHFYLFMLCRGVVGIGEASYATVAPTIIADMFVGNDRSTALMIFYFAIPIGSGLGYITGAGVTFWTGAWQWGVRLTPLIGTVSFVLLALVVDEPVRGEIEHTNSEPTPFIEDIRYLSNVALFVTLLLPEFFRRTYTASTVGLTGVVFVTGCLAWWTPTLVEHSWALHHGTSKVPDDVKAQISLVFGIIVCFAGLVGVLTGSVLAQCWRMGLAKIPRNKCADPHVCALGAFLAAPFLFISLLVCTNHILLCWTFIFLGVACCCLNWAVSMDILMYTVVSNRRSIATAIQAMVSHCFGDASSPYIIGVISDTLRGQETSVLARYFALQRALFLPDFVLVLGGAMYLVASHYIEEDKRKANGQSYGRLLLDEDDTEASPLVDAVE